MKYDFNKYIDRRGTDCEKWDGLKDDFGRDDLRAMWVADMDFPAPPEVLARCELYINLPQETLKFYNDLWTRLGI